MVYYHVDDLSNTTIHFLMFFGQFSMYSIKLYLSINKPNDGELFLNITSLILYYISNIIQSQHLFKSCMDDLEFGASLDCCHFCFCL